MLMLGFLTAPILPTFVASFGRLYQDADGTMRCFVWHKDQKAVCHCLGRKESLQHPWRPTRQNGWNSVCSLLHSLCITSCTNQTEEPCEPPGRYSSNSCHCLVAILNLADDSNQDASS